MVAPNIRHSFPRALKNEIPSQSPRTFEFNEILFAHSSDLQKCKNQLCAINPLLFGIFQKSGTFFLGH